MSGFYPALLNLEGRKCLVVGGGHVAGRKASTLLESGALVTVVSPEISGVTGELVDAGKIEWIQAPFNPNHMDGAAIVIASTSDEEVNRMVSREAVRRNIPVNVVDVPELCTFIVPSVIRRGSLVIAVSTSGKSPATSKKIRKKLEKEFGDEWGVFLDIMGQARKTAIDKVDDQKQREEIFNRLASSDLLGHIRRGDLEGAQNLVKEIMEI